MALQRKYLRCPNCGAKTPFMGKDDDGGQCGDCGAKIPVPEYMKGTDAFEGNYLECFVATVVYGDEYHPEVESLRTIRDTVLKKFWVGRKFINFYYSGAGKWSARIISKHLSFLIGPIRNILNILIKLV